MHRVFLGLLLSFFSTIFILILLELGLVLLGYNHRILTWGWATHGYYAYDHELIYRLILDIDDKDNDVYTDGFGFKSSRFELTSKRYKSPVVILGDSFVWGNTAFSETYPAKLEEILASKNKPVSVLNAGVSGYGTDQQYAYLIRDILPKIKPSVLVWNVNVNDIYDNYERSIFNIERDRLVAKPGWLNGVFLEGMLSRKIPKFLIKNSRLVNFFLSMVEKVRLYKPDIQTSIEDWSLKKMYLQFNEIKKLAQENDFIVIFAISPSQVIVENLPGAEEERVLVGRIKEKIGRGEVIIDQNDYLLNKLVASPQPENSPGKNGLILGTRVEKTDLFLDESGIFLKGSWHPNESGNYYMAESVANVLLNEIFSKQNQ